jgi:PKD repeat protein
LQKRSFSEQFLVMKVNPFLNPMRLFIYRKKVQCLLLPILLLVVSITASAQPVANFTASPVTGCAPLAVSFTDQSTGTPTTWQWDLGNGTQSTQQNPTTTYFNPGTYTVTLTVSNAGGSNTITRTQYITVNDKPTVNFIASDSVGCFPLRVNFTDLSAAGSGTITNWDWDFGDGTSSTAQNPFHIYTAVGNFTVTLKVTNSEGCVKVISKPAYIRVSTGVSVTFGNSVPQLCHPPENITFTNLATGPGILSHQWFFGDGGSSTLVNPAHVYTTGGNFTVTLITQSSLGCVD